jgi:hypothetical protein
MIGTSSRSGRLIFIRNNLTINVVTTTQLIRASPVDGIKRFFFYIYISREHATKIKCVFKCVYVMKNLTKKVIYTLLEPNFRHL